jgi:hypothetical protein
LAGVLASPILRITCGAVLTLLAHHFALAQSSAQNPAQQRSTRQWYEAYDEGLNHFQQRRWQQAIDSLLAAKAARGQQSRRVAFYGDRVDAYIPDYYLGVAYTELGRFTEAAAAFQRVTEQKLVVQGDRPFQNFQTQSARASTGAAAALAKAGESKPPAQTAANTAPPPPVGGGNPATGGGTPTGQSPVQGPPIQNAANAAPEDTVAKGPDPTVQAPPLGTAARGTQNAAAPAANRPPAVPPRNLPRPPAATGLLETDGVAAFFRGDYNGAGRVLETIVTRGGKGGAPAPTPRAWLFLASTITAQVLTGDRDRAELTAARQLLARAGSLSQFDSDRRLISPRILAALGVQQ